MEMMAEVALPKRKCLCFACGDQSQGQVMRPESDFWGIRSWKILEVLLEVSYFWKEEKMVLCTLFV